MAISSARSKKNENTVKDFRERILNWYDRNHRKMPWRAPPGKRPDPYHEWLSEIMLQQTTVNAVIPYFIKFIGKWPKVQNLAEAPAEEVMKEWAGLGYYARARNLHACAKVVAYERGGKFPQNIEGLKKLPGIGDYTANAIVAIAFDKPATVVDGNVERVIARYFAVKEPLPASKPKLKALAHTLSDGQTERPGDFAQGMMELGATICTPQSPKCMMCPVNETCAARREGIAAELPYKAKKETRPQRSGYVYWIEDSRGRVLLHRRPDKGLLGGMAALPTSEWTESEAQHLALLKDVEFKPLKAEVLHSFTHFDLRLAPHTYKVKKALALPEGYYWQEKKTLADAGFPTVFKKAWKIFSVD